VLENSAEALREILNIRLREGCYLKQMGVDARV